MAKSGQARTLSPAEENYLFEQIQRNRHPEKNRAIMLISFKLGLRVQEISLLQFKEVCTLNDHTMKVREFKLNEIMSLPAAYTKGANALSESKSKYVRKTLSFKIDEFDNVLKQVAKLAKAGAEINPEEFYPPTKIHKGKSRDLPMVNKSLRAALKDHIQVRLDKDPSIKPSDPLFVSQKGGKYSPNTLQEHMSLMLRKWANIEKASSHSGRRTLITTLIHEHKEPLGIAQSVAGHVNPSTTIIYTSPVEKEISKALSKLPDDEKE